MAKEDVNKRTGVESEALHSCSVMCLGPLTFHCQAVGDKVCLSQGYRLAERTKSTFKNGLVFSSRPLEVQERIRLRVEKDSISWHGALRVGFTTVPPSVRSLPLPPMAIPNATDIPGHWAAPVPEDLCQAGSELEFWVSSSGTICFATNSGQRKLVKGVDVSRPLWAMIDVYGQTCSVLLLGSKKRHVLFTRRSCPAPECHPTPDADTYCSLVLDGNSNELPANDSSCMDCVVCMGSEARITLPCGHRCLCSHCAPRVFLEFGACPLCRQEFIAPSMKPSLPDFLIS